MKEVKVGGNHHAKHKEQIMVVFEDGRRVPIEVQLRPRTTCSGCPFRTNLQDCGAVQWTLKLIYSGHRIISLEEDIE